MANNYQETSSFLNIPPDKIHLARSICSRVEEEICETDEGGYCNCEWSIEPDGVWFKADESFDPDHVEQIARALVEELDLDGYFLCSWCYLCSKPRVDEFGGGAFILAKGMPTYWVSPQYDCIKHYENSSLRRHQNELLGYTARPKSIHRFNRYVSALDSSALLHNWRAVPMRERCSMAHRCHCFIPIREGAALKEI